MASSTTVNDEDTEKLFGTAANHMISVKGLSLSSDQRLELYSLFKQATEGDCDEPKPPLIDLVGRAKWCAWNSRRGVKPLEAMAAYIIKVTELCPNWVRDAQGQKPPAEDGVMGQDEIEKDLAWEGSDREEDKNGAGLGSGVMVSTMAAEQGNTEDWGASEEIFAAASDGDLPRLKHLVSRGANIDVKDNEGRTPLHFAADRGHPPIIAKLLELGATVDARDIDGMTPLAYAVACEHEKEIELLVKAGADVNCTDNDGSSPLSSAEASVKHLLVLPKVDLSSLRTDRRGLN